MRDNRFNLVIEVLVVSRKEIQTIGVGWNRFNLVIEVLVVSSKTPRPAGASNLPFQSRNRGSCRFKPVGVPANARVDPVVSIS